MSPCPDDLIKNDGPADRRTGPLVTTAAISGGEMIRLAAPARPPDLRPVHEARHVATVEAVWSSSAQHVASIVGGLAIWPGADGAVPVQR